MTSEPFITPDETRIGFVWDERGISIDRRTFPRGFGFEAEQWKNICDGFDSASSPLNNFRSKARTLHVITIIIAFILFNLQILAFVGIIFTTCSYGTVYVGQDLQSIQNCNIRGYLNSIPIFIIILVILVIILEFFVRRALLKRSRGEFIKNMNEFCENGFSRAHWSVSVSFKFNPAAKRLNAFVQECFVVVEERASTMRVLNVDYDP